MDSVTGIALVVMFFTILGGLVGLNAKYNHGFQIEATWVAVAILPAVLWLVATGQLSEIAGFGLEVRLRDAAKAPVTNSLEALPIEPVEVESRSKGGFEALERMIAMKTPGLKFELRRTGYYDPQAIRTYLEHLTRHDWFRYVLFVNPDGTFAGMAPGKDVRDFAESHGREFVKMIEGGDLREVPGVVTQSIRSGSDKREALRVLRSMDSPALPVLDSRDTFIGIVERDRIVSDILLELVAKV